MPFGKKAVNRNETGVIHHEAADSKRFSYRQHQGCSVFLVVLGHMLGYLQETHSAFATGVRTFIYFFHMPGFIFMSGYLAKGFLTKEYKAGKAALLRMALSSVQGCHRAGAFHL